MIFISQDIRFLNLYFFMFQETAIAFMIENEVIQESDFPNFLKHLLRVFN